MEQFEKDFTTSCETLLVKEGNKLCEEVITFLDEEEDFMIEKSKLFCERFTEFMEVNKLDTKYTLELKERCKKYLENVYDYQRIKFTLKEVNRGREIREHKESIENSVNTTNTNFLISDLNMGNKKIVGIK